LPILTGNFFYIQSFGLSRTLIGVFLGDIEMGYFVLAMNILAMIRLVNYSVSKVLLPTIGEQFGRHHDVQHVAMATCWPLLKMLPLAGVLTVTGWFLAEPLTRLLLPQFLPGVDAARIVLLGMIPAVLTSTHVFFIATGKQRRLIPIFCSGLLGQFLIAIPLYHRGYGLSAFAWGFTGGMAIAAVIVNAALFYYLLGSNARTGVTGPKRNGLQEEDT
jgi:O-antigen/teichoic acid export membrane protein